jgi:hypothetical protein
MKKTLTLAALVGLAGCGAIGLSPEQMKSMEGLSASMCIETPAWNGSAAKVHYASFGGKSTGTAGGGGQATCGTSSVTFTNEGRIVTTPAATVSILPAKPASAP